MDRISQYLERALLAGIICALLVPLAFWTPSAFKTVRTYFRHPFQEISQEAVSTLKSLTFARIGAANKEYANRINDDFPGRKELIRWTNELWYRAFRVCPAKSAGITVGRHSFLYETGYLHEYCIERPSKESLIPLVKDIRKFQTLCDRSGIKTVILITPSKASIMPEFIPATWMRRYIPEPRGYDYFVDLLKENGVRFVDGHALTAKAKASAPSPIFAKGGTHWSQYGALFTLNALVDNLNSQGMTLAPVSAVNPHVIQNPKGRDNDLLQLMNLARPWRYPCTSFRIVPSKNKAVGPIAIVGGSFSWQIAGELDASKQCSEIPVFYYYKIWKSINPSFDYNLNTVRQPVGPIDFPSEIFGCEAIVLEINETKISQVNHLEVFLKDALSYEKEGRFPRAAFAYEGLMPCKFGETLSLNSSNGGRLKRGGMRGFSGLEPNGVWTEAKEVSLNLNIPESAGSVTFQAMVAAFVHPKATPTQAAAIYANGVSVGEWTFTTGDLHQCRVVIPHEVLAKGTCLNLRFEITKPTSPKSMGISNDDRNLGLFFSSITLNETN